MKVEKCTDYNGYEYKSVAAMCRHYNVPKEYYYTKIKLGYSQRDALKRVYGKDITIKDHLGNVYVSMKEMCDHYGVSLWAYKNRIMKMSVEDALTAAAKIPHRHECIDHLGNVFPSQSAMCIYWKLPKSTFASRMAKGYSLKDTLTMPRNNPRKAGPYVDHKGNVYKSLRDMCSTYGISVDVYKYRRNVSNLSIEEALTKPVRYHVVTPVVYNGITYDTVKELCEANHVTVNVFNHRIRLGMTIDEAVKLPARERISKVVDHLGNVYPNIYTMCEAYGIKKATYRARRKKGFTIEESLTMTPGDKHYLGPDGKYYTSKSAMCKAYNISMGVYSYRLDIGCNPLIALTMPSQKSHVQEDK